MPNQNHSDPNKAVAPLQAEVPESKREASIEPSGAPTVMTSWQAGEGAVDGGGLKAENGLGFGQLRILDPGQHS